MTRSIKRNLARKNMELKGFQKVNKKRASDKRSFFSTKWRDFVYSYEAPVSGFFNRLFTRGRSR